MRLSDAIRLVDLADEEPREGVEAVLETSATISGGLRSMSGTGDRRTSREVPKRGMLPSAHKGSGLDNFASSLSRRNDLCANWSTSWPLC